MNEVNILLVEDNEGDIILTKEALKEAKIKNEISVAMDGQEALAILQSGNTLPDLIILDINLPKCNGLELLNIIKADEKLKRIPVIMLSTSCAEEDIMNSYAGHANCYITKPVDLARFMEVVKSIESFWISIVRLPQKT
jgi:two-component system, chemotaxis family, response regulator Rcp1